MEAFMFIRKCSLVISFYLLYNQLHWMGTDKAKVKYCFFLFCLGDSNVLSLQLLYPVQLINCF